MPLPFAHQLQFIVEDHHLRLGQLAGILDVAGPKAGHALLAAIDCVAIEELLLAAAAALDKSLVAPVSGVDFPVARLVVKFQAG